MLRQLTPSPLSDPEALAINTRGELTSAQYAALRPRLPPVFGPLCAVIVGAVIFGFVLAHLPIAFEILRTPDPLPAQEHIFGRTFTVPGFRLMIAIVLGAWAFGVIRNLRVLIARAKAARELRPGSVRWVDGTIAWDGDEYVARMPGWRRPLAPWNEEPIENLAPGPYRFWFLPYGRWLLAVQPFATSAARPLSGQEAVQESLLAVLARVNHFHLDALEANRAGRLNPTQAQSLARGEKHAQIWALIVSIGLIAATPAFWWYGHVEIAFWGGLAGLATFVGLLRQPVRSPLDRDLAAARVETVEGPARKVHQRKFSWAGAVTGGDTTDNYYFYDIAGTRFTVSDTAYHALVDGIPCRAYYLPRSKTLLNLELLDGSPIEDATHRF